MKRILQLLVLCLSFSCVMEKDSAILRENIEHLDGITKSDISTQVSMIVLGERLPNPYAISNMQAAYDTLYPNNNILLSPTHLYVRFLPRNASQMKMLMADSLELFDYPLDYNIRQVGDYYRDPLLQDCDYTWFYTTVEAGCRFPNVQYEILEQCYIPEESVQRADDGFNPMDLERKAFELVGLDTLWVESSGTRSQANPSGRLLVEEIPSGSGTGRQIPIKGAKVRVHNFVKIASAYTDQNGFYVIDKSFSTNVHYALVFSNCKDFVLWGNYWKFAPANHNMGFHSSDGIRRVIGSSSVAWKWATVNNASYDYYDCCRRRGIALPPPNLQIRVTTTGASHASMLNRVDMQESTEEEKNAISRAFDIDLDDIIRWFFADVRVSTMYENGQYRSTEKVSSTVFHELAHTSHYVQVGDQFWRRYINYIINSAINFQGTYGNGTLTDAGVCEIGEMWGNFMGYTLVCDQYGQELDGLNYEDIASSEYWFKPGVFFNLYRDGILTQKQIFDCLTEDVDTRDALRTKLKDMYPAFEDHIDIAFAENGFFSFLGEWVIQNRTNQTIRVNLSRDYRSLPGTSRTRELIPVGPALQAKLSESIPVPSGGMISLAIMPYLSASGFNFLDFFNEEAIAPEALFVAKQDSIIFMCPYHEIGSDFFSRYSWSITTFTSPSCDFEHRRWTYEVHE